jgi:voltage-gated potassium channel
VIFFKLRRLTAALFFRANFLTVLSGMAVYGISSYLLLYLAGEQEMVKDSVAYIYWLVVTGSTVGYGDISPTTGAGKLITSFWVIPVGLSLFAVILTKVGFYLSEFALKGKKGLRMIGTENNCVIIGWNGARTLRLIELLLSKSNGSSETIVLCVAVNMENPLPGKIEFVQVESFTHVDTMARVNLPKASRIIIDTPSDDITLTTALFCQAANPDAHKTVYFQDESVSNLLLNHCSNVEVVPSVSVEMLARSSTDPGSSLLYKQLLDSTIGVTQYHIAYEGDAALMFGDLFHHFKTNLSATLMGVLQPGSNQIDLNPDLSRRVEKGHVLYYIADSRLTESQCFTHAN